jgi:hypothetical protein
MVCTREWRMGFQEPSFYDGSTIADDLVAHQAYSKRNSQRGIAK